MCSRARVHKQTYSQGRTLHAYAHARTHARTHTCTRAHTCTHAHARMQTQACTSPRSFAEYVRFTPTFAQALTHSLGARAHTYTRARRMDARTQSARVQIGTTMHAHAPMYADRHRRLQRTHAHASFFRTRNMRAGACIRLFTSRK